MNILVCIKQVPGTTEVNIDEETGVLLRNGVPSKMNPYDLYALECSLRLKKHYGGSVAVISMGPPQAEAIIKEAYMMGVDEGYLLTDMAFAGSDVYATAYALAQAIKTLPDVDCIICGMMTTDGDTAQVGPEIAEHLNIPHASYIKEIHEVHSDHIEVTMDMDKYAAEMKIKFPALLTVTSTIGTPRLPSYILGKKTEDKIVNRITLKDLNDQDPDHYGITGSPTQVIDIFPPDHTQISTTWEGTSKEIASNLADDLIHRKIVMR